MNKRNDNLFEAGSLENKKSKDRLLMQHKKNSK